jgi:hypothetical protein
MTAWFVSPTGSLPIATPLHREREAPLASAMQLATWPSGLGNGLQSRVHEFDSHRRLQPLSRYPLFRGSSRLGAGVWP